jgi:hypothetical protein
MPVWTRRLLTRGRGLRKDERAAGRERPGRRAAARRVGTRHPEWHSAYRRIATWQLISGRDVGGASPRWTRTSSVKSPARAGARRISSVRRTSGAATRPARPGEREEPRAASGSARADSDRLPSGAYDRRESAYHRVRPRFEAYPFVVLQLFYSGGPSTDATGAAKFGCRAATARNRPKQPASIMSP